MKPHLRIAKDRRIQYPPKFMVVPHWPIAVIYTTFCIAQTPRTGSSLGRFTVHDVSACLYTYPSAGIEGYT